MKEFNLEQAKAGKPVCTRDGRKARIICFDAKDTSYPIIALVEDSEGIESIYTYANSGKYDACDACNTSNDLMMAPEKHEGWVNIYKYVDGVETGELIYETKEKAISNADEKLIDTIKIEWEE